MGEILRARLEGPNAKIGQIPAIDVARLLEGTERAVARAAEARIGRQARTGRRGGAVESTTHLIFRGITSGSLIAELELPQLGDSAEELGLGDAHLGELAAADLIALVDDPSSPADDRVVDALATLGDELGIGTRYKRLTVTYRPRRGKPRRSARLDAPKVQQLRDRRNASTARQAREDRVVGTLVEADFEAHTAHVRTSENSRVLVTFDEGQADDIQTWLRRQTELQGVVEYDPRTGRLVGVELRRLIRPEQLEVLSESGQAFWRSQSIASLANEQAIRPIEDPAELFDSELADEEAAAFLDAIP